MFDGVAEGGPGNRRPVLEEKRPQPRPVGFSGLPQQPARGFVDQVVVDREKPDGDLVDGVQAYDRGGPA